MTAEEGLLHIKKIVASYSEEYEDWNVVEQMRHGGDLWENCIKEIKQILADIDER